MDEIIKIASIVLVAFLVLYIIVVKLKAKRAKKASKQTEVQPLILEQEVNVEALQNIRDMQKEVFGDLNVNEEKSIVTEQPVEQPVSQQVSAEQVFQQPNSSTNEQNVVQQ